MIDLAEQTRLLGALPQELEVLASAIDTVRAGEISRPVREIVPIAVRAHDLSIRCLKQLDTLAGSQYAVMKDGHENLAFVAEATMRVSLVSTLCAYGITGRTEALLYEGTDETPETSRGHLADANEELRQAAGTYRVLAQNLSRRLASAAPGPRTGGASSGPSPGAAPLRQRRPTARLPPPAAADSPPSTRLGRPPAPAAPDLPRSVLSPSAVLPPPQRSLSCTPSTCSRSKPRNVSPAPGLPIPGHTRVLSTSPWTPAESGHPGTTVQVSRPARAQRTSSGPTVCGSISSSTAETASWSALSFRSVCTRTSPTAPPTVAAPLDPARAAWRITDRVLPHYTAAVANAREAAALTARRTHGPAPLPGPLPHPSSPARAR